MAKNDDAHGLKRAKRLGIPEEIYFRYIKDGEFIDCNVIEDIQKENTFICPKDTQILYYYDDKEGIYFNDGECIVKSWIAKRINPLINKTKREEIIEKIKIENYIEPDLINSEKHLIIMQNGIYNLTDNSFSKHTKKIISTVKIPVKYNPKAKCKEIDKFFKQLVYERDLHTVYEILGYCLCRDYPIRRAFIFYGETKNGKSTLIDLMQRFLGTENTLSHPLHALERDQWAVKSLYGKLANMCADISGEDLETSSRFRELVGNDRISIRTMRSERTFSFTNYAKLIFSANEVPMPKQDLDSFYNRVITITFPNQFIGDAAEHGIVDRIATDAALSGLFNVCVEHLKLLLERKKFSGTLSDHENKLRYKRLANPVQAFCDDKLIPDPDSFISTEQFRNAANVYFMENGMPPLDNSKINKKMQTLHGFSVVHERKQQAGNREWGFYGVKFKDVDMEIKLKENKVSIEQYENSKYDEDGYAAKYGA